MQITPLRSTFSLRFGGPIAPPRSYVPISAPIRASKQRPDQGTTKLNPWCVAIKLRSVIFWRAGTTPALTKCSEDLGSHSLIGVSLRGVTEGGGFHTAVRGTMFVRDGAVTPRPSRECNIAFFVKGRPKSAQQLRDSTVAACRVQSVTVPSSRVTRECRSPA